MNNITLYNDDCLKVMKELNDKSVDLVLMDPPYNINKDKTWDSWKTKEMYVEFMGTIFLECQRVLKDNGQMYWFHNDMVQISMLMEWIRNNTDFRFNSFITWNKCNPKINRYPFGKSWVNPTEKNTLRSWFNTCEYILYYIKGDCLHTEWDKTGWDKVRLDVNNFLQLRQYAYEMLCYIGGETLVPQNTLNVCLGIEKPSISSIAAKRSVFGEVGGKADHFMRYGSTQWSLCTKETYDEIIRIFHIDKWEKFKEYESLRQEYESLRQEYESLRQEYESLRYKHNLDKMHNNVWTSDVINDGKLHSCQKPIDILERIIKCSTNENDVVLDCFMGSGSTGVACMNTNRDFIGIELDEKYFNIAKDRIEKSRN